MQRQNRTGKIGKWPIFAALLLLLPALLFSCQSSYGAEERQELATLLQARQFAAAAALHLEHQQLYDLPRNELLFYLNQSSLEYYNSIATSASEVAVIAARPQSYAFARSATLLDEQAEKQNSFNEQTKAQAALQQYPASLQESLWQNIFASLYYWNRQSLDGALVELRQNHAKVQLYQKFILQKDLEAENNIFKDLATRKDSLFSFRNSALMQYLGAIYYREDKAADDVRITLQDLADLTSDSDFYKETLPREYLPSSQVAAGKGALNFAVFSGRGVSKYAQTIRIVKVPGGVALQFADGSDASEALGLETILIPTLSENFAYYEMSIPQMQLEENIVTAIGVSLDGGAEQLLYPLEQFASIDKELFKRLYQVILPKRVTEFVLKVVAAEVVQAAAQAAGGEAAGLFAGLASSAVVSGSGPVPDLRVANFKPSVAWVGELQVAPGRHQVQLKYYASSKNVVHSQSMEVQVEDGQSLIIQDYYAR